MYRGIQENVCVHILIGKLMFLADLEELFNYFFKLASLDFFVLT